MKILTRKINNNKINICVLGSSSSGNCTVIWNNKTVLLIDCGLPVGRTKGALNTLGIDTINITACILTHSHTDHVNNAMFNELSRNGVKIVCCKSTFLELQYKYSGLQKCKENNLIECFLIDKGKINDTSINNFKIKPFIVKHDCPGGCFGYRIINEDKIITIATDFGQPQQAVIENFYNSNVVIIESNFDEGMLIASEREPELIDRIQKNHISNKKAGEILRTIFYKSGLGYGFKNIILTHLSPECNQIRKARKTLSDIFKIGIMNMNPKITVAYKETKSKIITI